MMEVKATPYLLFLVTPNIAIHYYIINVFNSLCHPITLICITHISICVLFVLFLLVCRPLHWNKLFMRTRAVSVLSNTMPQSLEQRLPQSSYSINIY